MCDLSVNIVITFKIVNLLWGSLFATLHLPLTYMVQVTCALHHQLVRCSLLIQTRSIRATVACI